MHESPRERLALELLEHTLGGNFQYSEVRPVLNCLLEGRSKAVELFDLQRRLCSVDEREARTVVFRIQKRLLLRAKRCHDALRRQDTFDAAAWPELSHLPVAVRAGWDTADGLPEAAVELGRLLRDLTFLDNQGAPCPGLRAFVADQAAAAQTAFSERPERWLYLDVCRAGSRVLPARSPAGQTPGELQKQLAAETDWARRKALLDQLLCWAGDEAAVAIAAACTTEVDRLYAATVLTVRFGGGDRYDWEYWARWLRTQAERSAARRMQCDEVLQDVAPELRLLWTAEQPSAADPGLLEELRQDVAVAASAVDVRGFVRRWQHAVSPAEQAALLGRGVAPVVAEPAEPVAAAPAAIEPAAEEPATEAAESPGAPPPAAAAPPAAVAMWHEHVQPVLAENWYMLAGLLLVVVGASLLAFSPWGKHWLLRYTLMPGLLAAFTFGLAELGGWLQRRHSDLTGTAAALVAGAIGLVPLNLMFLCRLARDPGVPWRLAVLAVLSGVYLAAFGVAVRRWCGKVHDALARILGNTLSVMAAVVAAAAFLRLCPPGHAALVPVTVVCFYAACALACVAVHGFLGRVLTAELIAEQRVPAFFCATLGLVLLEAFVCVHYALRIVPSATVYAMLLILVGHEVFGWEARLGRLRASDREYNGESFVGYALVVAGLVMSVSDPVLRIATFVLAGCVWLAQARRRPGMQQYWIGMVLVLLGGAAIGMLDAFPRGRDLNLLPVLGLGLALGLTVTRVVARRAGEKRLCDAAVELQPIVLLFTTAVSLISQLTLRSAPAVTALTLVVVAAFFLVRALALERLSWLHAAMALLALALPYSGCVDMRTLRVGGNTMPFGLAVLGCLWLGVLRLWPREFLLRARSTVLWTYGALAVAAMVARVSIEGQVAGTALDVLGPWLMAAVLTVAAYTSRSPVPGLMAGTLVAVLFPELRFGHESVLRWLAWGSGLGSALSACALVVGSFAIRRLPALQELTEGDRMPDAAAFPVERRDSRVFTVPMLAAGAFLCARVCAWDVQVLIFSGAMDMRAVVALGVCAVTWPLAAVFLRQYAVRRLLVACGWVALLLCCLNGQQVLGGGWRPAMGLFWTGLALQLSWVVFRVLTRGFEWIEDLFLQPLEQLLARCGLVVGWLTVAVLLLSSNVPEWGWLALFLMCQLAWHGVRTSQPRHGVVLFVLTACCLAGRTVKPGRFLLLALSMERTFQPLLVFALALLVAAVALEHFSRLRERILALAVPLRTGAMTLTCVLALFGVGACFAGGTVGVPAETDRVLLVLALALFARSERSGMFGLLACAAAYVFLHVPLSAAARELLNPRHLAAAALALCACPALARVLKDRCAWLLAGRHPLTEQGPNQSWWFIGACLSAVSVAALLQVGESVAGTDVPRALQLLAPFAAVSCYAAASWYLASPSLAVIAGILLGVANVDLVALLLGRRMAGLGMSANHVASAGLFLTLAELRLARLFAKRSAAVAMLNHGCVAAAGLVLGLLVANYVVSPDLATVTSGRCVVSGLLALGAGLTFRWAAGQEQYAEQQATVWLSSLWHTSLALALWCLVFLVPALRQPAAVMPALAVVPVCFWVCAELGMRQRRDAPALRTVCWRHSASMVACFVLALYVSRAAFQMVLFPGVPVLLTHYHDNAVVAVAMGLLLLRLHGLGGDWWLGFYGGLAVLVGCFFGITAYPGLSPFDQPLAAAWTAVVLTHFFTLGSVRQSPLRTALHVIANLDGPGWNALRRAWGRALLWASQLMVLVALLSDFRGHGVQVPLLGIAAASVLVHHAILGASARYYAVACVEVLLALHADFLLPADTPALIAADNVVWVLLAVWAGLVGAWSVLERRPVLLRVSGLSSTGLAWLCMGHVLYQRPASGAGVAAFLGAAVLSALTPVEKRLPGTPSQARAGRLLLVAPIWAAYFGVRYHADAGPLALAPWVAFCGTVLGIAAAARHACRRPGAVSRLLPPGPPLLLHRAFGMLETDGDARFGKGLGLVLMVMTLMLLGHYGGNQAAGTVLLFGALWGGLAWAWFVRGADRPGLAPNLVAQLCIVGALIVVRWLVQRVVVQWSYEHDVWVCMAASCCLAGGKRVIDRQEPSLRTSLLVTLWTLPALQLAWALFHGLGTDLTLVVLGLNSVLFAAAGGGDRESPLNAAAIAGAVAFVLLFFWTKLELRVFHAYTIPTGMGVLGLLQLFGENMTRTARNRVRLVTLCGMLGSTGYYVLTDPGYGLAFHLTMVLLCVGAMALGGFLRVRLYLVLGFAGLIVDLAALVHKVALHMQTALKMMGLGVSLLLIGVALVVGAIYYKTNREELQARFDRLRQAFGEWE